MVNIHIFFRKCVRMLGDFLSHKAIHGQCVHNRGLMWGFRGGSAGADIFLVYRPMWGRALSNRRMAASRKDRDSTWVWNSAFTKIGQTLASVFPWVMCWVPLKPSSLTWFLNSSEVKAWETFLFPSSAFPVFWGKLCLGFLDPSSNVFHCFDIILPTVSSNHSFGHLVSLLGVIKFVLDYFPLVRILFYTTDKIYT